MGEQARAVAATAEFDPSLLLYGERAARNTKATGDPLLRAIAAFRPSEMPGVGIAERKVGLVVEYADKTQTSVIPEASEMWGWTSGELKRRELLSVFYWGAAPGSAGASSVDAWDHPDGPTLYTVTSDYPETGTFLVAAAERVGLGHDAWVVEELLTSNGGRFGMELVGGPPDEIRSILPRKRLAQALVGALDGSGGFEWEELVLDEDWEGDIGFKEPSQEEKLELVESWLDRALRDQPPNR